MRELVHHQKIACGPRGGPGPQPFFAAFLDLRKAFDKVPRALLWKKLQQAGVGGPILEVIKDLFTGVRGKIRLGD